MGCGTRKLYHAPPRVQPDFEGPAPNTTHQFSREKTQRLLKKPEVSSILPLHFLSVLFRLPQECHNNRDEAAHSQQDEQSRFPPIERAAGLGPVKQPERRGTEIGGSQRLCPVFAPGRLRLWGRKQPGNERARRWSQQIGGFHEY